MSSESEYSKIKERLLRRGQLFEDPDFPATARSIRKDRNVSRNIVWKRPKELSRYPRFIVSGATRLDLHQGELGDCWFIAGVACVAVTSKKHFERVVPPNQSFDDGDYAGIFQFNFWQYDRWVEVVVDDRIPTKFGRPVYAHNRISEENNEYWVALLEKAYAKLYGSYDSIDGGHINDALVDFTGGISERLDLKNDRGTLEPYLYELISRTVKMASMMGCSIDTEVIGEESLSNGLYAGHAYSITKVSTIDVFGNKVRLLRLRNPWGKKEWTGAWGDRSREWRSVTDEQKKQLGLEPKEDGEFWMEYSEWIRNFEDLDICHLFPDALTKEVAEDMSKRRWEVYKHHGEWVRGFNAGGCGNSPYEDLFWTNPQFSVSMSKTDDVDADGKCTIVISLMQKHEDMANDLFISFSLYKLKEWKPILLSGRNYDKEALYLKKRPETYKNMRECTGLYRVEPGTYVIIPATFQPKKEGQFFLRIFSESASAALLIDEPSVIVTPSEVADSMLELFHKHSGGERRVDADELQNVLTEVYKHELQRGFGIEVCRSLVAMMDRDKSGLLDYDEFRKMIKEINVWKGAFGDYDTNKSGDIDTYELSKVFETIGFKLSRQVMSSIIRRYGGKKRRLQFEDFIHCCTKIVALYGEFSKRRPDAHNNKMELSLEEWLATTMLY